MMWEVPDVLLQLQLIWAADDWTGERLKTTGHRGVADGYVRTDGRLSLAADNQLLEKRQLRRDPRRYRPAQISKEHQPHVLLVPPGVYAISVFNGLASESRQTTDSVVGYTVVLRHHPHPAPRRNPVRLGNHILDDDSPKAGVITSHAHIY